MVRLSRIYTRTGDDGSTALGDGSRLPKHDLRIAAYGTVDEASSAIGLARVHGVPEPWNGWLLEVQNDLFDVGSDLCVPGSDDARARVSGAYVERLEHWIDEANAELEPLSSFVLPGGKPAAAWLHLSRTVCRRAERLVSELGAREPDAVNHETLRYLNRLSDLLFVLARAVNDGGAADVLWEPGRGSA